MIRHLIELKIVEKTMSTRTLSNISCQHSFDEPNKLMTVKIKSLGKNEFGLLNIFDCLVMIF